MMRLTSSAFLIFARYSLENSIRLMSHGSNLCCTTSSKTRATLLSKGSSDGISVPLWISSTVLT